MAISVEDSVIARITHAGEKFEILVDPHKALDVKAGKEVPLEDLVVSQEIYEDSGKGLRASEDKINKAFGTNDVKTVVYKIIKKGEVQLTTEQRRKIVENKTKAIATMIAKEAINPQTGLPHPVDRITRAMEQAKVRVSLEEDAEQQIESTLEAIQSILPIKIEKVRLVIKIPPQFAGKSSSTIRKFGKVIKEEWKGDGSYICMIEIPGGIQQDVYDKLNGLTHGDFEVKKHNGG